MSSFPFHLPHLPLPNPLHPTAPTAPAAPGARPQIYFGSYPAQMVPFQPDIPIDPALIPLPSAASLPVAAIKVARVRRSAKPKAVADRKTNSKRGRPHGSSNFSEADIWALLDVIAMELPLGEVGWKVVGVEYNKYAKPNGRPERTDKTLSVKYKQLVKTTKPTGDAECPAYIDRAHEIDGLINERAGTRDLNDSDLDEGGLVPDRPDAIEISNDESVKVLVTVKKVDQSTHVRKPKVTRLGIMESIAKSLDPSAQHHRDASRAEQSLAAIHIYNLNQQLRDSQQVINSLRSDLAELYNRIHTAESARDKMELKLELMRTYRMPPKRKRHYRRASTDVISLTDTDTDENKENHPPALSGQPLKRTYAFRIHPAIKMEPRAPIIIPDQFTRITPANLPSDSSDSAMLGPPTTLPTTA